MHFPFLPALKELVGRLLLAELQTDAAEAYAQSQKKLELKARELEEEGFPEQAQMLRSIGNNGQAFAQLDGPKRGRPRKEEG